MYRHKEQKFWPYQISIQNHYVTIQKNSKLYFCILYLYQSLYWLSLYFPTNKLRGAEKERNSIFRAALLLVDSVTL